MMRSGAARYMLAVSTWLKFCLYVFCGLEEGVVVGDVLIFPKLFLQPPSVLLQKHSHLSMLSCLQLLHQRCPLLLSRPLTQQLLLNSLRFLQKVTGLICSYLQQLDQSIHHLPFLSSTETHPRGNFVAECLSLPPLINQRRYNLLSQCSNKKSIWTSLKRRLPFICILKQMNAQSHTGALQIVSNDANSFACFFWIFSFRCMTDDNSLVCFSNCDSSVTTLAGKHGLSIFSQKLICHSFNNNSIGSERRKISTFHDLSDLLVLIWCRLK